MKRTADLIHVHRAIKRMTLRELSERVDKSQAMLSAIELNKKNGSIGLLKYISDVLEIPKSKMFKAIIDDTREEIKELWESLT